jgi:hypothetical protein
MLNQRMHCSMAQAPGIPRMELRMSAFFSSTVVAIAAQWLKRQLDKKDHDG